MTYHPLPDGNKRAGYATMRMFLDLNGVSWRSRAPSDLDAEPIEQIAAGAIAEADLIAWVRDRTSQG